ncbi:MAG TPA: hypothetical protein VGX68_28450 [Thermoanaerobaculia bacterium]|jgi:hypothetical protein|nr:hypothetical protein [Thermoanaerobaculia bacterium]
MSQRNRIVIAALVLGAILLASPSRAAGLWEDRLPGIGALEQVWNWMSSLWQEDDASGTTAIWEKDGGAVIPDGQPHTAVTPPAVPAQEDPDS